MVHLSAVNDMSKNSLSKDSYFRFFFLFLYTNNKYASLFHTRTLMARLLMIAIFKKAGKLICNVLSKLITMMSE